MRLSDFAVSVHSLRRWLCRVVHSQQRASVMCWGYSTGNSSYSELTTLVFCPVVNSHEGLCLILSIQPRRLQCYKVTTLVYFLRFTTSCFAEWRAKNTIVTEHTATFQNIKRGFCYVWGLQHTRDVAWRRRSDSVEEEEGRRPDSATLIFELSGRPHIRAAPPYTGRHSRMLPLMHSPPPRGVGGGALFSSPRVGLGIVFRPAGWGRGHSSPWWSRLVVTHQSFSHWWITSYSGFSKVCLRHAKCGFDTIILLDRFHCSWRTWIGWSCDLRWPRTDLMIHKLFFSILLEDICSYILRKKKNPRRWRWGPGTGTCSFLTLDTTICQATYFFFPRDSFFFPSFFFPIYLFRSYATVFCINFFSDFFSSFYYFNL